MIGPKKTGFIKVDWPAGLNDLVSMVEFLKNQKKFTSLLDQLRKYTDEANDARTAYERVRSINHTIDKAESMERQSSAMLDNAKLEVTGMLTSAKDDAIAMLSASKDESLLMRATAEEIMKEAQEAFSTASEESKQASHNLKVAEDLQTENDHRAENLDRREAVVRQKETILGQLDAL